MNAIQFIKENGFEKARKVIDGAPYLNSEETHFCADVFVYTDGFDDDGYCQHCVDISDLKRLVESVDMVKEYGGISMAKRQCACFTNACTSVGVKPSPRLSALQQAIADYELLFCSGESK
jgi:hypothetical protein